MGSGVSEYERGALILSEPRGRFAFFFATEKDGRRPGHGPLEQKSYLWRRNWEHFETARRVVPPYDKIETVPGSP